MQDAVLILSQETKERIAEESLLGLATCKSLSFHFSFSRSLALLSRSLGLFFSVSLPFTQSLHQSSSIYPPPLSLLLSLLPSHFFFFYLSLISFLFSHAQLELTHFISLSLSNSLYFSFSLSISFSLLFSDPLTHSVRLTSCLLCLCSLSSKLRNYFAKIRK